MKIWLSLLVGVFAAFQSHAVWSQSPHFLSCEIPAQLGSTGVQATARAGPRIFRVAPNTLEEWDSRDRQFGVNLCETSACRANAQRSEGSITTASMAYNIGVDHKTGKGYWRAKGASNLPRTEGKCDLIADPSQAATK